MILKWRYLKPGPAKHSQNLIKYIAQRDGVDKIDDTWKQKPATKGQQRLIRQIVNDFPASKNSYEYQDFMASPNKGNASEFIGRAIEDNADAVGKKDNYMRYIANRPHVEKHGTHGLFTDADVPIDLNAVAKEVSKHQGMVWTNILSLRREDAARLGFEKGEAWRNLLRSQAEKMAVSMKIPLEDLRWYAAFHNEGHHPHCHIVAYSVGKAPYATEKSMTDLKTAFAREIFRPDRIQIYELQTEYRDRLAAESKSIMQEIIDSINAGIYRNPNLERAIEDLHRRLGDNKGKKNYSYLPGSTRKAVDAVVEELAKDTRISRLYDLWYEQQCQITRIYQDKDPEKLPLSGNKVFKPIQNMVLREAFRLSDNASVLTEIPLNNDDFVDDSRHEAPTIVDSDPKELPLPPTGDEVLPPPVEEEPKQKSLFGRRKKNTWWTENYKQARSFLYGTKVEPPDLSAAFHLMTKEAQSGNGLAMHELGKMYLSGLGSDKDDKASQKWFADAMDAFLKKESTEKRKDYWQYRIGKLYAYGYGTEQDYAVSAQWFAKAIAEENPHAAYSLGGQYYHGQGVEQDSKKAFSYFSMAASNMARPNANAQYQLGAMYRDGVGVDADREKSDLWYRKAYQGFLTIEQQMADDKLYYRLGAMNLHGVGTEKDLQRAKDYFEKAVALGNVDALYGLAKLYLDESFPDKDTARAVIYLKQAVAQDHSFAQYTLGKLLFQGEVTEKEIPEAIRWLSKAAESGNAYAQYFLGKALLYSDKLQKDIPRGLKLLEQSAEQDNIYAHYTLGKVFADGEAVPQDIARAIAHLEEAAKHGFSPAQYRLAKILLEENKTEDAVRWLEKAIQDENQYAQYLLGKMLLFGQGIDKDVERGMALLQASAGQGNEYAQRIINNYGKRSPELVGARLFASLGRIIQNQLQEDNKKANIIDKKLRQKIEEKKQAHGLKMG